MPEIVAHPDDGVMRKDSLRMHPRSIRAGAIAALVLAAFYAVVVAGASGSVDHLRDQVRTDWYLLVPIVAGFAVQVAVIVELRRRHSAHAEAMAASAAGAGASTTGMIACCAHHLADLAPFLGATGAASFLTEWRVTFMLVGVGVNAVAVVIGLRRLHQFPSGPRGEVTCAHA